MFCCPGIDVGAIIEKLEELEQPPVIRNSRLAIGLFADTLPTLTSRLLTTSVWCILTQTYIQLHRNSPQACGAGRICGHAATWCSTSGTDSTAAGPNVHEQRAWRVFADRTGLGWTVTGHGFQQWAVRIT
jgi:hypothetical protein